MADRPYFLLNVIPEFHYTSTYLTDMGLGNTLKRWKGPVRGMQRSFKRKHIFTHQITRMIYLIFNVRFRIGRQVISVVFSGESHMTARLNLLGTVISNGIIVFPEFLRRNTLLFVQSKVHIIILLSERWVWASFFHWWCQLGAWVYHYICGEECRIFVRFITLLPLHLWISRLLLQTHPSSLYFSAPFERLRFNFIWPFVKFYVNISSI